MRFKLNDNSTRLALRRLGFIEPRRLGCSARELEDYCQREISRKTLAGLAEYQLVLGMAVTVQRYADRRCPICEGTGWDTKGVFRLCVCSHIRILAGRREAPAKPRAPVKRRRKRRHRR